MMKPDEVEAMLGFYGLSWGTRRIAVRILRAIRTSE